MRIYFILRAVIPGLYLALASGCTLPTKNNQDGVRIGTEYMNPSRTFSQQVVILPEAGGVMWKGVNVYPKHPTSAQKEDISLTEVAFDPIHFCSNSTYRCIYGAYRVFAVPRTGLTATSAYAVGGAVFRVQHCLRSGDNRCQVALISSDCQQRSAEDACEQVSGEHSRSSASGPVLYFIYNEDFGVTSYGSAEQPVGTKDVQMTIASGWILKDGKGLLAE